MRLCVLTLVACLILSSTGISGGKVELKWKDLTSGFSDAKKSNKKVLVDVYTDWCGWCKRLDKDVYGNDAVSNYLSKQFVVVKLNAESRDTVRYKDTLYTSAEMAQALDVRGYPKIIFFEPNGDPINFLDGYVPADKFLPIIKYIGEDYYKTMSWKDFQAAQGPTESTEKSKKK